MIEEPKDVPASAADSSGEAALTPATDQPAAEQSQVEPPPAAEPDQSECAIEADLPATVEAVLFSSEKPLPPSRIADVCGAPAKAVREAITHLNERYEEMGCSFRVTEIAGGFQMQTLPEYADVLARLLSSRNDSKLSQAAMETLAVVAYRQPALRADIEAIRGVACGEVLRTLMERNLVRIVGRAEEIGRPMLYGTTKYFLEVFGLANLEDLPNAEQLRRPQDNQPAKPAADSAASAASAPAADAPAAADAAAAADVPAAPDAPDAGASESAKEAPAAEQAASETPTEAAPSNDPPADDSTPGQYVSDRPGEPA